MKKTAFFAFVCMSVLLTACGSGGPSKAKMQELIAKNTTIGGNVFFGGGRRASPSDIKIVKQECKNVENFDNAFDCKVFYSLQDNPQEADVRVIKHDSGEWTISQNGL